MKSLVMKKRMQILVVDDNIGMLRLITSLLSDKYDVISKQGAIEAFAWLEEGNHPSLIISDLSASSIDSPAFIKHLKVSGFYKNTPIITFLAINPAQELRDIEPTVDACFSKPFNPMHFTNTIGEILTQRIHAA